MRDLIKQLNYFNAKYEEGHPEISDKEYDNLYFKLKEKEEKTGIIYPDSPTQSIQFDLVNSLNKVEHNHPMLSLDKTKDIAEMEKFVDGHQWIAMSKMDGLTCSLLYENGKLVSAETRGNGKIGEDITHNARVIKNLPQSIKYTGRLVVDGEVICTKQDFAEFAAEYKNPRNFAAGSIRLLDSAESAKRNLSFIAWDAIEIDGEDIYLSNKLGRLEDMGFEIVHFANDEEYSVEEAIELIKKYSLLNGYPIDGVVFKWDNCQEYAAAGKTDHHFRAGMAFKFYDDEYETSLREIEWTMGRTGTLTPVAIFDTVDIDGSDVSRANLHNVSVMKDLFNGLPKAKQTVFVYKANAIIPQISRVEDNGDEELPIISVCPYCGAPTETFTSDTDSTELRCTNDTCSAKAINKLDHFCGKKGLDIKGLSKMTLEKLIDLGWVSEFEDIFKLKEHRGEWIKVAGFGQKSVDNILAAIETARHTDLVKFISAIGIPLVGPAVAKEMCKFVDSYEDLQRKIEINYNFMQHNGFGIEMHNSIVGFDYSEADKVIKYLDIENKEMTSTKEWKLAGLTFCITGKLAKDGKFKNRDTLTEYITFLGGKVSSSVTSKTDYLINNDVSSQSAKNNKAKSLGVKIISEEDFINFLM